MVAALIVSIRVGVRLDKDRVGIDFSSMLLLLFLILIDVVSWHDLVQLVFVVIVQAAQ